MKRFSGLLLVSSLLFGGLGTVAAQEKAGGVHPPPKVLVIIREFLKPGKNGMTHEKTESGFVQAFTHAKWPTHYLAADSLSGKPRSLFFVGYDSFEAWEKDSLATQKNATLAAALDHAGVVDGELLSEVDMGTFRYSEEYSLSASVPIANMRYFEISVFHVRPGHYKEWDEAVKLVMAAYAKIPDVHWATYEALYGADGGTYLVFTPMKSLAEVDRALAQNKQFMANMGEEGMKKLSELEKAGISSSQSNLFQFNPRISYVPDDWVKADPDFWKPKPAGVPAAEAKKSKENPKAKP